MTLREVSFESGEVQTRGAWELERTPGGTLPRRLPAWTRAQLPDIFMNTMVTMTAGVRLVFATDSPVVELTCHPRTIHTVGEPLREPVFQMLIDGELQPDVAGRGGTIVHVDRVAGPAGITFEEGGPVVLRWEGLGTRRKEVEIWLPTNASVELHSLRVAIDSLVEALPVRRRRWTHYGSSISHCMDVDRPFDAWPAQVARRRDLELTNFALAGQCQLDPFMGRVIRDAPADVISVKVGINLVNANSMTER
ncbi:MAG: lipase, partial [Acidobacteria bacterium]|nr:lipase [Acidobacteriota bacterium]